MTTFNLPLLFSVRQLAGDRSTMTNGRSLLHSYIHAGDSVCTIVWVSFASKKILGRTETRTRDRMYFQTIRSVRDIYRDDWARIATCTLRTLTDRNRENYSIDILLYLFVHLYIQCTHECISYCVVLLHCHFTYIRRSSKLTIRVIESRWRHLAGRHSVRTGSLSRCRWLYWKLKSSGFVLLSRRRKSTPFVVLGPASSRRCVGVQHL